MVRPEVEPSDGMAGGVHAHPDLEPSLLLCQPPALARHVAPVPGGDFGLVNAVEAIGQAVREAVSGGRRGPGKPALRPNRTGG